MRLWTLLVAVSLLTTAAAQAKKVRVDDPPPVSVSGRIADPEGNAVANASIYLVDRLNQLKLDARTNAAGHFEIKHERVPFQALQIVPPPGSGLAQAILKDIPAHEGRHVYVKLKPGVTVTGRVLAGGRPLKGATVRALAKVGDTVHDTAEAVTDRKGLYSLSCTPGEKIIEVSDVHDSTIVGVHKERHKVLDSCALPDISVPANRTAGAE
jgi:hypothetical protein